MANPVGHRATLIVAAGAIREVEGVLERMRTFASDRSQDFTLRTECVGFGAFAGQHPKLRPLARGYVESFLRGDLDHHAKMALERIERSAPVSPG